MILFYSKQRYFIETTGDNQIIIPLLTFINEKEDAAMGSTAPPSRPTISPTTSPTTTRPSAGPTDSLKPIPDSEWQNENREPIQEIKEQLEARAKSLVPMDGFSLARADLAGINLVNRSSRAGYHLTNSDLYRANLEHAHLFEIDLSGCSLMKTNFAKANLNYANLEGCNLLGVNLKGAKRFTLF